MIKCKTFVEEENRIPATSEFIEKNKLTLSRTTEEIKARAVEEQKNLFGDGIEVLITYLPFSEAKEYFKIAEARLKPLKEQAKLKDV